MEKRELVIVGGGPAGLTAAIYGRRAGLDVLVLEKGMAGGQITITAEIENWPGIPMISGEELARAFREHAEKFSPEFREAEVKKVSIEAGKKVVATDKGDIEAEAVIIATGASFRKLGCPGEAEFTGRGVSYCAVCDGAFFEDQVIAVVGGGNTAVEEADYLTRFASKVYIIHRRDSFRADRAVVEKAMANPKIEPVWNSVVEKIKGTDMVEGIVLKNVKTGETSELPVAGVFVFVGMNPNSDFVKGLVETKDGGWIVTNEMLETSVEGIFAAGDVRDKFLRQVVTAAGDGATAAMAAYSYISEQLHLQKVLFEPERVVSLFYSSIDQEQIKLANEVEKKYAKKVLLIDGYKNKRMCEKLGIVDLPQVVVLNKGSLVKSKAINDAQAIEGLL
ncbi:thioredoxin-disulfide reductase [Acetomicrobium hydrogeniformans]|uniref:Thioredoxin reductase n=1 Tax=Acetomicrobium hydrogeniformans ATCC BAA-1850 TaxID=592015 RepID=A0A0T5XCB1_9BACT|nr:thioredoxin-disulfide reductase [Acetomicrobium hydrogeniformans]KRT35984.1 thioredoxin-disulfide reductase [Acetomicrobium hydrogeniformans ATCC BAA-1850]